MIIALEIFKTTNIFTKNAISFYYNFQLQFLKKIIVTFYRQSQCLKIIRFKYRNYKQKYDDLKNINNIKCRQDASK